MHCKTDNNLSQCGFRLFTHPFQYPVKRHLKHIGDTAHRIIEKCTGYFSSDLRNRREHHWNNILERNEGRRKKKTPDDSDFHALLADLKGFGGIVVTHTLTN